MGIKHRFKLHKVLVQSLCFSPDEMYLGSLGGQDDNRLVIWDVETGKAVCGNAAGSDKVTKIKFYNHDNNKLVSVQNYGVKLWTIDYQNKKVHILYFISLAHINSCQLGKYEKSFH